MVNSSAPSEKSGPAAAQEKKKTSGSATVTKSSHAVSSLNEVFEHYCSGVKKAGSSHGLVSPISVGSQDHEPPSLCLIIFLTRQTLYSGKWKVFKDV